MTEPAALVCLAAPQPLTFPRVNPRLAAVLNRLSRLQPVSLLAGARRWQLAWQARTCMTGTESTATESIHWRWGDGLIKLEMAGWPRPLLADVLGEPAALLDVAVLDPGLQTALLEAVTEPWLAVVERLSGTALRLAPQELLQPAQGHVMSMTLLRDGDYCRLNFQLSLDDSALTCLDSALSHLTPRRNPALRWCIPMPLSLLAGWSRLDRRLLDGIEVGDLLLADTPALPPEHCYLAAGGRYFVARYGQQLFTIMEQLTVSEPMNMPEPAGPGEQQLSRLDELPVLLEFEVGRQQMSLAQIESLAAGAVIELARPLAGLVVIRANGCRIGSGELVQLGDKVALCIQSLAAK